MSLNLNKRNEALQNTAVIDRKSLSLPSLVHGKAPKVLHMQIKIHNNEKNLANLLKHADRWMKFHEVNGASISCVFSLNSSRSGDINQLPLSPIKIAFQDFQQHYLPHLHLHCLLQNPVENFNSHLGIHRLGILRSRTWRQPLQTHSARKASWVPQISRPTLFNGRVSVMLYIEVPISIPRATDNSGYFVMWSARSHSRRGYLSCGQRGRIALSER